MTPAQVGGPYDERMRRAKYLSSQYPFAAEILNFYHSVAGFQKQLYSEIAQMLRPQRFANAFDQDLDLAALLPQFPSLLSLLTRSAPAPVAEAARQLSLQGPAAWITFLSDFWRVGRLAQDSPTNGEPGAQSSAALTGLMLRAFLQPLAEFLATQISAPYTENVPRVCPLCGSAPLLGVLRPEGDGGKRFLTCSFCLHEWGFRRIFCAACGEEVESKLPVYVAEQFPHIRVEACDTCKFYVRTIDLTKDGFAIPIVDDLAALPLTLWAQEHGYSRIHGNLLGA